VRQRLERLPHRLHPPTRSRGPMTIPRHMRFPPLLLPMLTMASIKCSAIAAIAKEDSVVVVVTAVAIAVVDTVVTDEAAAAVAAAAVVSVAAEIRRALAVAVLVMSNISNFLIWRCTASHGEHLSLDFWHLSFAAQFAQQSLAFIHCIR